MEMKRGAQPGNTHAAKGLRWAHAIDRAIDAWPERALGLSVNKGLDKAAYEFVNRMMLEKDLGFFKEFGDRIDGKAAQLLIGDPEQPLGAVAVIERSIVRPKA
jgi:hypothetical protein